jgi:peroxiredoxin (alkyl hydroperoxide reductase subunit C)
MAIQVGDKIPSMTLKQATADGIKDVTTDELFTGKVVLFAVPGAFTPTCSAKHLPGYVQNSDGLRKKGVERIVCLAVNDAFVMGAWGRDQNVRDQVAMVADGNGEFTRALGLELDASRFGMGTRSQRFAMIVENGVVRKLNVEAPGKFEVSNAETLLAAL